MNMSSCVFSLEYTACIGTFSYFLRPELAQGVNQCMLHNAHLLTTHNQVLGFVLRYYFQVLVQPPG